jgi:hypothetical protein
MRRQSLIGLAVSLLVASCGSEALYCETWASAAVGADGCTATYSSCSDGATYEVSCAILGAQSICECVENTITVGTFSSDGFCSLTGSPQKEVANTGCGWSIEG